MSVAGRIFVAGVVAIFIMVVSTIIGVVMLISINRQASQIEAQSKQAQEAAEANQDSLRIILNVTGCTLEDTPKECRGKLGGRSEIEGVHRIEQVDCRFRLALAGKPPPPPGELCKLDSGNE